MHAKTVYYMHTKQISYHIYACENCILYARQTNFISYICMRKLHIICTPNKFHIIYMHAKTAYYMHAKQISYHIYACENCVYARQTNFISYTCMQKLRICTPNKFHIIYMHAKTAYYMHAKQISYHIYARENCVLYARQTNFISYICTRKLRIICTPNKFHIIYMHAKTAYYMHAKQISYHIHACENCVLYARQTNFISYICTRKLRIICTPNKFHIIYMHAKTAYMHAKQISYHIHACKNCVLYARQTNFISYTCMQKLCIICTPNKFHIIYMHAKTAYYMQTKQISYHIYARENCVLYARQTNFISYICMQKLRICTPNKFHIIYMQVKTAYYMQTKQIYHMHAYQYHMFLFLFGVLFILIFMMFVRFCCLVPNSCNPSQNWFWIPRHVFCCVSDPDSHERRLADSLDQALNAALHGLPVFTSPSKTSSSEDGSSGTRLSANKARSLVTEN